MVISEQEKKEILNMYSEGIFDPIKNRYQGLKGVWRGEGYDYFKSLSELGNIMKQLKKLDQPNLKVISRLTQLESEITNSKMPPRHKTNLSNHIKEAIRHFGEYQSYIDNIERAVNTKLK